MTAKEIFTAALDRSEPAEREAYVGSACGGDEELRRDVEALLKAPSAEKCSADAQDSTVTLVSDALQSGPDTCIGPYKLVRKLGEGGMGVVYHAQQVRPIRRDVALKIVKPGMDSEQVIARFESERQALAMMAHPNIARVFDVGTTPAGRPYFVMEIVDGVAITRYCDARRLTIRERLELFIPVCQAIQHAHQKGIIHRDVKPSNILVVQQDDRPIPKVIDFGLAKAIGQRLCDQTMCTNLGTIVGTLEYMSPEQADLLRQDIDTRSDIYTLGAVLYELLTGATALAGVRSANESYVEVLQRIREEELIIPSARLKRAGNELTHIAAQRGTDSARLPKLVRGELDWIVTKALEKDRTRRYETANALVRDLQRYLHSEPVEAGPPSAAYRLRKFAWKYRLWLGTGVAFATLLVAAVIVSAGMAVRASRAEQVARVVNSFLQDDLLAQAALGEQAGLDKPDPDLKVRTALDRAAARVESKFASQPLVEAAIRQTIGIAYLDVGVYPEAERHLERSVELRRRMLGSSHPDTLKAESRLGVLYGLQGKWSQAATLLEKVLEKQRRLLGSEQLDTLATLNNLTEVFRYQGKYAESEALLAQALKIQRRVRGPEHPETLATMVGLASIYLSQGKHAQAEEWYVQALETSRRILGPEHPRTLTTLLDLGSVYVGQGRYVQAAALYIQALEIQRRVRGPEHPETLIAMNNLAAAYLGAREYVQAEPLFIQALEVQRRVRGPEHPSTLATMNNLARLYQDQGKYAQSERLLAEAFESSRRTLGSEHPVTMKITTNLGFSYWTQGKYLAAEHLLRNGLSIYEKRAPDDWGHFRCASLLGASLSGLRRYAEAEPLLLAGYRGMLARQVNIPPEQRRLHMERALECIVQLYDAWGKPEQASEWRARLVAVPWTH